MEEPESKSLYKELGIKIAHARKGLNLTQEELAQKLEIQQSTLACYESGKRKPTIALIIKISEVLNVYIEDLLPIEQSKKKRGPKSKLEKELDKIRLLPEEKIKAFLHLIEVINKNNNNHKLGFTPSPAFRSRLSKRELVIKYKL